MSSASDDIDAAVQRALGRAEKTLAMLNHQMEVAKTTYQQMMTAVGGLLDYKELIRNQLRQASYEVNLYKTVTNKHTVMASNHYCSPIVNRGQYPTSELLVRHAAHVLILL